MVEYTYLVGSLITILIWFILYYFRKDLRKEMIVMGSIVMILGLIMEAFVWTKDWWRPVTITGSLIGVEDLLFGFGIGGVSAVIYEELFKKRLVFRKKTDHHHTKQLIFLLALSVILGNSSYFGLGYNSAISWVIAIMIPTIIMYILRPDLILDSVVTGSLLAFFGFIEAFVLNLIEPGFVYNWWLFESLSGIVILELPLEDIIWFFTAGLFVGIIYEFWQGGRLQKIKKK